MKIEKTSEIYQKLIDRENEYLQTLYDRQSDGQTYEVDILSLYPPDHEKVIDAKKDLEAINKEISETSRRIKSLEYKMNNRKEYEMMNSKDLQALNSHNRDMYERSQKFQTALKHLQNPAFIFEQLILLDIEKIPDDFRFGLGSPYHAVWVKTSTGERLLQTFDENGNFNAIFDIGIFQEPKPLMKDQYDSKCDLDEIILSANELLTIYEKEDLDEYVQHELKEVNHHLIKLIEVSKDQ